MANSFAQELHKHPAIPGEDATRTEEKRDEAGGCFFRFCQNSTRLGELGGWGGMNCK